MKQKRYVKNEESIVSASIAAGLTSLRRRSARAMFLAMLDVTYSQLIEALDQWVIAKSNNQAIELFAELRRFWKFAAPLFRAANKTVQQSASR
ncbi:hypothetical protein AAGU66_03765 [Edwardsiella ictaluri]|uniref:Uncharacterized protein n=1 Tax=Edwardsiella ictaluri TaxID=67780 RepID=A0ABY8GDK9_EDWIC|nr:hypothetical protein [Edwardsiella ictaluri]EKS7763733.1 hypothetical protein [Edwardsiella ictaluri]EKS7771153.1 hypothetical protein [Edwardsiella ictaluri]EKS7774203.1 hypothetical protein [Edwardsiella ictaluri]EKS7777025.1 hypothetical protein [Edwardsiella ictaluri]EKS7787155.1 hypothetical protein [Edwardsiella ictaluri]